MRNIRDDLANIYIAALLLFHVVVNIICHSLNKPDFPFIILEFANTYFWSLSIPLVILRTSDTAAYAGSSTSSTIIRAPGNYRVAPILIIYAAHHTI